MSMFKHKSIKKMNRVSKLINDIRSSNKHTDSLVVQTGFPTSLIDLFVKHRDRVKNKKHNKTPSPPHPHPHSLPLVQEIRSTPDPHPIKLSVFGSVSDSNTYAIKVSGEKRKVVFMNVMKMFVILSFAFVTKRVAISVTFWAFLLLILEQWFKAYKTRHHLVKAEIGLEEDTDLLIDETEAETDSKEDIQFGSENQIEECKLSDSDLGRERCVEESEFVRMAGPNKMCRAKLRAKRFRKLVADKFRGIEGKEQHSLIAPVQ